MSKKITPIDQINAHLHSIVTDLTYSRVAEIFNMSRQAVSKRNNSGYKVEELAKVAKEIGRDFLITSKGMMVLGKYDENTDPAGGLRLRLESCLKESQFLKKQVELLEGQIRLLEEIKESKS